MNRCDNFAWNSLLLLLLFTVYRMQSRSKRFKKCQTSLILCLLHPPSCPKPQRGCLLLTQRWRTGWKNFEGLWATKLPSISQVWHRYFLVSIIFPHAKHSTRYTICREQNRLRKEPTCCKGRCWRICKYGMRLYSCTTQHTEWQNSSSSILTSCPLPPPPRIGRCKSLPHFSKTKQEPRWSFWKLGNKYTIAIFLVHC